MIYNNRSVAFWSASSGESAEAPLARRTAQIKTDANAVVVLREIDADPQVSKAVTLLGKTAYFSGETDKTNSDLDTRLDARDEALDEVDMYAVVEPHFDNKVHLIVVGSRGAFKVQVDGPNLSDLEFAPTQHPAAKAQFASLAGDPYVVIYPTIEITSPIEIG